jgi:type IV pilus assembly protein PilA
MKYSVRGFSLLELMVVLAIVAFLAMIAMPNFMRLFAKAKRMEAYTHLRALYLAEKAFFAEHGTYTSNLGGTDGLGWKADGRLHYTYGFNGSESKNYKLGSLKTPASALVGTYANATGFKAGAAGDIDNDGVADFLTIDHNGEIKLERDDLD